MKTLIIAIVIIALAGIGLYLFKSNLFYRADLPKYQSTSSTTPLATLGQQEVEIANNPGETVIGQSVEGRAITAFHYGTGETELLFIGGIHGGYSWNTVLVAYQLMDYLKENPNVIPSKIKVTVIPVLNPDGLNKVVGTAGRFTAGDVPSSLADTVAGRFNARTVDLNRNFDCDWQPTGKWQNKTVSGGSKAFSEPESQAMKNYVETHKIAGAVTWYSAAGGVYASSCENGISSGTRSLMKEYANASGYAAYDDFDFYEITGDMVNWFAKNKIPAISVLLTNHTDTEWTKNQKGMEALLRYYTK